MSSTSTERRLRLAGCAAVALALAATAGATSDQTASTGSAPAGRFSGSEEVRAIEIPVQVTAHGQPVRGLTAADFKVWAGKKPETIVGFDVVDLGSVALKGTPAKMTAAPVPIAGRRHVLFLFDLSYSDPRSLERAQKAALDIADQSLDATDLAAVGIYSPVRGARMLLNFTSDRGQLKLALSTLGSTELVERHPDYLGLLLGQASDKLDIASRVEKRPIGGGPTGEDAPEMPNAGRDIAEKVLNDMKLADAMHERDMAAADRDRVRRFTTSMADLGKLMQQVEGRKHVVFLSRGFDASLLTGQQEVRGREISEADEEMREIVRTDSDARWGNTRLQGELRKSLEELKKSDCVIHAIDISGAEVAVRGIAGEASEVARSSTTTGHGADSLFVMAHETGGTFHQNFNDAGAAMRQVLETTSLTYVLTIQPAEVQAKNGYVPLRVEVPGVPGAQVSARPGFFVGVAPAAEAALRQRLQLADLVMAGQAAGQIHVAVLGVPMLGATTTCAIIEVDGESLLTGHVGDMASAEVSVYAFDADGTIRASARQLVGMDLRVVADKLRATGFKLFAGLDLPPGSYQLRTLVRNTVSERFGIAVANLVVPETGALAGAFVEPPGRDWLLVRDSSSEKPIPYPFTLGERVMVPAAAPHVHAGGEVTLWVQIPAGANALEGVVKRADGQVATSAPLALAQRAPDAAAERMLATFSAAGLVPGGYTLEVRVPGGAVAAALPFTVE
jgi:VWFA-related protein